MRLMESGESMPLPGWRDSHRLVKRGESGRASLHGRGARDHRERRGEGGGGEPVPEAARGSSSPPFGAPGGLFHTGRIHRRASSGRSDRITRSSIARARSSRSCGRSSGRSGTGCVAIRFRAFAGRIGGGKGYEFVTIRGERYVVSLPARRGGPDQGNRAPDERERRVSLRGAARVRG